MNITERQKSILDKIINEYINSALPVSSQLLEKKYDLGISSATIRNEMYDLTNMGYLYQPHTSAGRVPTSKGYRFFVDRLFELKEKLFSEGFFEEIEEIKKETDDGLKFAELLTKELALVSSNLALTYLSEKDFLWKDGWNEVFQNPEFKNIEYLESFIKTVGKLEKDFKNIINKKTDLPELNIYIGGEKSFLKSKNFSLIIAKSKFLNNQEGLLAILGPIRMSYKKNISLINTLIKELENF